MIRVLSLGAGVQSTCVLLMSCTGVLPKLDAAVFADTQWEPTEVYKHLAWLEAEAANYGIPVHRVTRGDLRQDAIDFRRTGGKASGLPGAKRWASMPLYILSPDGGVGIVNRQCTKEYKVEPIERFIRRTLLGLQPRQVAPANAVEHWFGISADETQRRRTSPNHWQTFRYPLIDDVNGASQGRLFPVGFERRDCLQWMETHFGIAPPRSACLGCPFHSDDEWRRIRTTDPEGWADAVAFDRDIRAADAALQKTKFAGRLVGLPYLHRSCKPLDEAILDGKPIPAPIVGEGFRYVGNLTDDGLQNECLGHCGV